MEKSVSLNWQKKMAFETVIDGHKLSLDAASESGGEDKGMRPKWLLLAALGGCTGMDVVAILEKMRVELDDFNVHLESELTDEHPKAFTKIKVIYEFTGTNLDREKLEKAVKLSEERYCGVEATLKKAVHISSEVRIKEK